MASAWRRSCDGTIQTGRHESALSSCGARTADHAVLLKVVLLAYSRGLISSRAIERACRENVLFMAISGDT
jgi:transposase